MSSAGYELEPDEMFKVQEVTVIGRPDGKSPGEEICYSSVCIRIRARPRGA